MNMHNDNGPRPEATPVHEGPKRSKKALLLPFLAGILVAGLIFSAFAGFEVHNRRGVSASQQISGLVPVVDYMRFAADDVSSIAVSTRNGSVEVRLHSESYIAVHDSNGGRHGVEDGVLTVNSRNGSFTIMLPEVVFDALDIYARNGRVHVGGVAGNNTVLAQSLAVETRNGSIRLIDLAVPGDLDAETRNGSIDVSNVLADEGNTRLHTRNGRINAD